MRQDSDSDLFARVGASSTAPAARAHPRRGELNSGFFTLESLYAVEEPLIIPVHEIAPPLPAMRAPQATAMDAYEVALTRRIPRPIGWYAVFVTWLATMTLAAAATTQVPAHVRTRVRPSVAAMTAATAPGTATAIATAAAPTAATAKATATATAAATASAKATATAPPTATPSASSTVPLFVVSDLPRVQTKAAPAPRTKWVALASRRVADPPALVPPKPAPAPAPVAATPAPAPTAAPAPPPVAAATPAAPALATPLSTGGTLEDLIRREVAAEQKKVRAAKAQ